MRWDALFADLQAQAEQAETQDRYSEVADRARGEVAQVDLRGRLFAATGSLVRVRVGPDVVAGVVERVGADWVLVRGDSGRSSVVCLSAVDWYDGLPVAPSVTVSEVLARLGVRSLLRRVARDRAGVVLVLTSGQRVRGTLERVGADWLEITRHEPGERRAARDLVTVPVTALAWFEADDAT